MDIYLTFQFSIFDILLFYFLQNSYFIYSLFNLSFYYFFSSLNSSITNQNGIATFNLTGLSTSATYTCTYQNVSDTCTVTVSNYLFYDDCTSVDGLSSYGNGLSLRDYATTTLSYDSTMNAYKVTNSARGCGMIPITVLNGKNNFKFEFDLYSNTGDKGLGFAMKNTSSNDFHYFGFSCYANRNVFWSNNSETIFGNTITKTTWHHIIITVTSSTITYDIDNGSQTGSFSTYISMDNNVVIGIESQWVSGDSGYVKNIIVEPI